MANVDAMLRSISAIQWMEWKTYMLLAPFTEEREDIRTASICEWIVNMQVDRKKHPEHIPNKEFRLLFGDLMDEDQREKAEAKKAKEQRVQTADEIQRIISEWVLGSNIVTAEALKRGS